MHDQEAADLTADSVTSVGKLFTRFCHQTVQFGTGELAVMLCDCKVIVCLAERNSSLLLGLCVTKLSAGQLPINVLKPGSPMAIQLILRIGLRLH